MVLKGFFIALIVLPLLLSCTTNSSKTNFEQTSPTTEINAKTLYTLHCEACHGMDGAKGISGAANLKISKITDSQIQYTIENGNEKGMMPFKDIISSKKEIDALVIFVKSLRN